MTVLQIASNRIAPTSYEDVIGGSVWPDYLPLTTSSGKNMARDLTINGARRSVDVDDDTPLLWVLRDVLGLTGTKFGCGIALCGACTVHVDGAPRRACITPVGSLSAQASIRTIEALSQTVEGRALQQAWLDLEVVQCGYCQSGQLMSAAALLAANRSPTSTDIDAVMSGNICRCGTYGRIRSAIEQAANQLPVERRATDASRGRP